MASSTLQNNDTVKSAVSDVKSDSMLEDITDDDGEGDEQDLEDSSDDETNEENTRCKDVEGVKMCELEVSGMCEGMSRADAPVTLTAEVKVDELNAKSNHIVKHIPTVEECVDGRKAVESVQNKLTFDNASVQSSDSVERPQEMDGVEDKHDNDHEEIDDEPDDDNDDDVEDDDEDEIDDELIEDDDDEEGDHVRLDGDGQDVEDDEFTSDSFCSELYSSHTSSSFSPSISDGMTTPNSITNDTNDGSLLPLGSTDEKPFRQGSGNHHIHPRHHHAHHRRTGTAGGHPSSAKEGGKSSLKHHHQLNNNNSSSHNHNNNNNNNHGSNSKGLNSTYHCQFCEKTFPRLGYLKKHEQSHTEHMPFKCEYCARLFKHKRSRDRHTKLHTGDRRYRCLHCEAAFSRSDHLKIHMKTHDNQKPFQCTICNRGYNTAAALTSHMQNHKKQLALTGSPNLTYSPRSTTSSLSSGGGGGGSGGGKRGAKFSPYANDPLMLMSRGSSKLSSTLAKATSGNVPSNRTPTPGSTGAGSTSGAPGGGGTHVDTLSCPYCTRTDFSTLEQLGLHVQSMHGHGALGLLGADTSMPYFTSGSRRAVTPDGSSLSLSGLGPYPPITCEFCTMKFPTVPLMFAHLKTSHLDRLAGAGLQRSSPNGTTGSPLGGSRPPSGFHPLEQLHFNKSLLGNAFPSFYGGAMGAGSSTNMSSMSGGSIKMEHRPTASSNGRDENENEASEMGRKRKRKGHDGEDKEKNNRKADKQQEGMEADANDEDEEHVDETDGNANRSGSVDLKETGNAHELEAAIIKQERKEETDPVIPEATSPSTSTRSSPCDSLGSIAHPVSHPPSGRNTPAEQLTPTDLSQPKMKRLKLETLLEDEEVPDKKVMVGSGRSHSRDVHKQRGGATNRREGELKDSHLSTQHQHISVPQLHTGGVGSNAPSSQQLAASSSSASHHAHQLPGAYLCNQCNAALPDFESFRTHLKAHLEQSAANAAAAAAMRLAGEHNAGPPGGSNNSSTSGTSGGSLSLTTFLCQQCGATLSCQAEYEQHTIGHFLVMAVEYRCQAAGSGSTGSSCSGKTAFGKVEDLHKHLYEGHMQLLYKCTVCGETFESKVQVQVHFAVSHSVEVKLYRCSACAEVFRSEREFRQHIRNRHLTAGAVQCMFCRMVCSSELEMHFHLASHARKFKCPACPESFHVEFLLDRHIQTQHSQKETNSPNRREPNASHALSTVPSTVPSTASLTASTATGTSVSTTATSAVAGLDYLQLHGQMAAMAAAAAWPSLYQTANKFYNNPLQVDTLSQLKHPQHLLHGFYDTMLGKAHQQQQQRTSFIADPPTGSGTTIGSKKNPFTGQSPNTSATNALLGLGYGTSSSASTGTSQPQRSAGSHTLNGSASGLYSPEEGTNAGTNVPAGSGKLYSPIAMIQRYGDNGGLHSTGATGTSGGTSRPGVESPTGQLLLASHTTLGLSDHHHSEQTGRKTNQQTNAKPSSTLAASGSTPQLATTGAGSCYSCGICERSDFSTESEVQTHRKIVHNLKTGVSLRCAYCNGDFRSRNELENHMKVAHNTGGGKHKCLICDEIFPSPAVLAEHKLSHCKVGASGRCSHCSLPLPDAHTFKQHLQVHQPVTGGSSTNPSTGGGAPGTGSAGGGQTGVNASSSTNGNGNASGSSNAEQERFPQQCICCRQTLNSEFEISLHAKFHTKSPDTNERTCALCLEPLPSQPESSTKICDPCLKRHNFPSKLLSMNFLKPSASTSLGQTPTIAGPTHGGIVGPSTVPIEGRTPTSGGIQHEQQPSGGRDSSSSSLYQCNLCKKPLPSSQKLQEHLIDHTFAGCEERGYVCYLCSAVFTSSAGLQAHLPVAHTNAAAKPYDCERCGVAYFFRAELEHHLIDHELGRSVRTVTGSFEHSSTVRTGDDGEWRSEQNSPVSEDDGLGQPQRSHIKQELCETEQDRSSPYCHKEEDTEEENEEREPTGNDEDGEEECVNAEQQIDGEDAELNRIEANDGQQIKHNAGESVYQHKNDAIDDDVAGSEESNDATNEGELMEEREQSQEQDDEEEYIEVDEHTTPDDVGGKPTHNERLRRPSNMLLNGGKDCSTLTGTTTPTLPVVTAAE
ncbi:zinc finger protein 423 homolog isoform X2 [Anopheles funestus]|nr:zinc finger protein 423 homolog isoform X2 [Anopheles funestus]